MSLYDSCMCLLQHESFVMVSSQQSLAAAGCSCCILHAGGYGNTSFAAGVGSAARNGHNFRVMICFSGCLPHVSEGRGESQPAAHSPEFQSHNLRSTAPPNGLPQTGAGRSNAQENQAQSARSGAHRAYSNGHVAQTEGVLVVHDVLSGEDSAPDIGRAVTSPAPGSTPGVASSLNIPFWHD